jgi:uroporphyrin-3 C-methyltransferase
VQPPHSPPPQQIPQLAQTAQPAEPLSDATREEPLVPPAKDGVAGRIPGISKWGVAVGVLAALGVLLSLILMQRLSVTQELLARQSQDSGASALEAKTIARQTQSQLQDVTARLSVLEVRLSEVALQRTQLEELMQSLSRSRDENLVVDIESAIRLAQQQAQLTGSLEPLLAALKSAELRVQRTAQPRLVPLQRAIAKDLSRIRSTPLSDTPALLVKLDELVRLVDELPLANAVSTPQAGRAVAALKPRTEDNFSSWWERSLTLALKDFWAEVKDLVRVGRVEAPEAVLLSPEQSFFVRENLKLKLLNARLGVLARQLETSRSDLNAAAYVMQNYFDAGSRKTQSALTLVRLIQAQTQNLELPRVDETLAALATASAGR